MEAEIELLFSFHILVAKQWRRNCILHVWEKH